MSGEMILIVDDEEEIGELVGLYLKKEGFTCSLAGNGMEAVSLAKGKKPSLILLDVLLPDLDGFEVCRKLREFTKVPIIFLSCKDTEIDKVIGLSLGADDYVSKPFGLDELVARIKANLRRHRMMQEQEQATIRPELTALTSRSVYLNHKSYECFINRRKIELSAKEFQLLAFLMRHSRQVLSPEQLLQEIWGFDYELDSKTVKVHMGNLRKKVEENPSKPQVIVTIRGVGYKFNEDVQIV